MKYKTYDCFIREKVLYPLYQAKNGLGYGSDVDTILKSLLKSEAYSQDELTNIQTHKFKRLIDHVYHQVPYYRDIMNGLGMEPHDIKSIEDIKHFPVQTKDQIKNNYNKATANDIHKREATRGSTGGTTGEPLVFFRDKNAKVWSEAAMFRGMLWTNYRIGDSGADFRTDDWPSTLGKLRGKLLNFNYFPAFSIDTDLLNYFQTIQVIKPFFIIGYASNLYRISKILQQHNVNNIKIPVILTTGEMLYPYQREFIEDLFRGKVYDYYGCNETGSIAYECEYKRKHISGEHLVIETVNSNEKPVTEMPGSVTITDLENFAMPFIRYKNGDIGYLTNKKCSCSRGLKWFEKIEGRSQEFLKTYNGNHVPAIFFPTKFRNLTGIDKYQVIQTGLKKIVLKIVKNHKYSSNEIDNVVHEIKKKMGHETDVSIDECKEIPVTSRGKTKLVINQLPEENIFSGE